MVIKFNLGLNNRCVHAIHENECCNKVSCVVPLPSLRNAIARREERGDGGTGGGYGGRGGFAEEVDMAVAKRRGKARAVKRPGWERKR